MKYVAFIVVLAVVIVVGVKTFSGPPVPAEGQVHHLVAQKIDSLLQWYDAQWLPAIQAGNERQLQALFLAGRKKYKETEWAVEYFFPTTAKELNGAPLPEIEPEEHIVIPPSGFQVIEELIYPYANDNKEALLQESRKWYSVLNRLKILWQGNGFRADQVWDAVRLQLLRINALGLSGFDTPLSLAAISELPYALKGVVDVIRIYKTEEFEKEFSAIDALLQIANQEVESEKDFNAFNRMRFIHQIMNPLGVQLQQLQAKLQIPFSTIHAITGKASSFFDSGAFNANFFTPGSASWLTAKKVELGKRLFNDAVLSTSGKVSCASCHKATLAFTDGLTKSKSFGVDSFLQRNTPTVLYAGFQQSQFYDMRASFLEDQVKNVIDSRDEIHGSLPEAAAKLARDQDYIKMFQKAFTSTDTIIAEQTIQIALAAYIRSLSPFNSPFDAHMRGQKVLTDQEVAGFNLFMGKAKCGSCHFMPLFNGTIPPMYQSTESEVLGTPLDVQFSKVDTDPGRYGIHQLDEYKAAFKTPTLRNVALTAPYMHNGVFQTLEEVVDFYNEGGATGMHHKLENQTLPADKLQLTKKEKEEIILFLKTITDKNQLP